MLRDRNCLVGRRNNGTKERVNNPGSSSLRPFGQTRPSKVGGHKHWLKFETWSIRKGSAPGDQVSILGHSGSF